MLTLRGLGRVLGDLAALGYDCRWTVLGAADVGAPHQRDRFWLVAHHNGVWQLQPQRRQRYQWGWPDTGAQDMANANQARQQDSAGGGQE